MDAIRSRNLRIILDPMYGVSRTCLQTILLTARCDVDVIHERHDTLFGGRLPAPTADTLRALQNQVMEWNYDLGIATDGDADRLGVIDDKGHFLHPNDILVLLYYYLIRYKGLRGPVVRNLATTHRLDQVAADAFDGFDYVALGHIHGPQKAGPNLRYCGTPLKYSFSEASQHKSVTFVELAEKGSVTIAAEPLVPRHDLRELRGSYMELTDRRNYDGTAVDDYLHITLTDEQDVPDALARLRVIYPNLMRLDYDNLRTREDQEITAPERAESITPLEHFSAFYQLQNNQPLTAEQAAFCQQLIEEIWKEGEDA